MTSLGKAMVISEPLNDLGHCGLSVLAVQSTLHQMFIEQICEISPLKYSLFMRVPNQLLSLVGMAECLQ